MVKTMRSPVIEKPVQLRVSQTDLTTISFFTYSQNLLSCFCVLGMANMPSLVDTEGQGLSQRVQNKGLPSESPVPQKKELLRGARQKQGGMAPGDHEWQERNHLLEPKKERGTRGNWCKYTSEWVVSHPSPWVGVPVGLPGS